MPINERTAMKRTATPTFMPVPRGLLQRECACGSHSGGGNCSKCQKDHQASQRENQDPNHARGGESLIPSSVRDVLSMPGAPLDASSRGFMEPRFGHDFSRVRVHTDSRATESARAVSANAYTVGDHIVLGERYSPGTTHGHRLLAHELTHVVQQDVGGAAGPHFSKIVSQRSDASEIEAEASADRVMSGGSVQVFQPASAILQGDLNLGEKIGIGAAVVGGLGLLGLGIAALAGAFSGKKRWSITQNNTDGPDYVSDVNITFNPDSDSMNCSEIAFLQVARLSEFSTGTAVTTGMPNYDARRTGTGWMLDRIEARRYGWYAYNNDGSPSGNVSPGSSPTPLRAATMHDGPAGFGPNRTFQFETCATCKAGTDANRIYNCLTWGFNVDAKNQLTSLPNQETAGPSPEFADSVKQWNVQAAGPAANRNEPTQEPVGPLR